MTQKRDITGQRFGQLVATRRLGTRCRNSYWEFLCDCGAVHESMLSHVTSGKTLSCGCLQRKLLGNRLRTHGREPRKLYEIWKSMRRRCSNPADARWSSYGGRGIAVDARFRDFAAFRDWAQANGYASGLSIDRRDNDGPYSPENCRWIPMARQASNTRATHMVTVNGTQMSMADAARAVSIPYHRLRSRINLQGMTDEEALYTPPKKVYRPT